MLESATLAFIRTSSFLKTLSRCIKIPLCLAALRDYALAFINPIAFLESDQNYVQKSDVETVSHEFHFATSFDKNFTKIAII